MAKKAFGVNALSQALENKKSAPVGSQPKEPVQSKSMSSPINSPGMSKNTQRIQRLYLDLPVSRTRAECELMELDPTQCVASPFNKRIQSLLSANDPAIQQLKASVQKEGQRDPVLIRPVAKPTDKLRYEIVYGTRRRFVAELIAREEGEFKLKAWVSNKITDPDAKRLADSENSDRQDISAWELAQYYQRLKDDRPELSLEAVASIEGVDGSSVYRYLQLAQLPEATVKLVVSPAEITLRSGLEVLKAFKTLSPGRKETLLASLTREAPYATAAMLVKAIKELAQPKPATPTPTKNTRIEILGENGQKRAVIGVHRSNEGQFKVDLFNVSDTELMALHKALQKVLGC